MDAKNRIEIAKVRIEKAKNAKLVAETQKAGAEKEVKAVIEKMAELGVTPDTIAEEIAKLQAEVEANLSKVEQLIPTV